MKREVFILGVIILLFSVVNVSAGIYFSQPEATYNLGDTIINEVNIDPVEQGFLRVDLVCEGNSVNVFSGIPVDGSAHIEFPLSTAYIQEISGECSFLAVLGEDAKESRKFQVSKALNVVLDMDSLFAKPGEEITVSGTAKRLNQQGINGEVEISIPLLSLMDVGDVEVDVNETEDDEIDNNETEEETEDSEVEVIYDSGKFYGKVSDGIFLISFTLAEDIPAGDYRIDVLLMRN